MRVPTRMLIHLKAIGNALFVLDVSSKSIESIYVYQVNLKIKYDPKINIKLRKSVEMGKSNY